MTQQENKKLFVEGSTIYTLRDDNKCNEWWAHVQSDNRAGIDTASIAKELVEAWNTSHKSAEIEALRAENERLRSALGEPPLGAVINGQEFIQMLGWADRFKDKSGHPLSNSYEWSELRRCFDYLGIYVNNLVFASSREMTTGQLKEAPAPTNTKTEELIK